MPQWFRLAILIGSLFAVWPFILRKSNLEIGTASSVFAFWSFVVIVLANSFFGAISTSSFQKISLPSLSIACIAATAGGIGVFLFNHAFSTVKPHEVGQVSAVVTLVQVIMTILIYIVINACSSEGAVTGKQLFGFLFAFISIYLLCFK